MSKLQPIRGTHDLIGSEAQKHIDIISIAQSVAQTFCCEPIATPLLEYSQVFKRTLGESSDIVNKEMYTFLDRNEEELTLRPEGTAGVARAFLTHGLSQHIPLKLYYAGPMFRYERPQKGRSRQFHQFGVEFIGADSLQSDVEVISLANEILNQLNLSEKHTLEINSLGDLESRATYKTQLVEYFNDFKEQLSEDSQKRLSLNPLRILDSKDEGDKKLIQQAPLLKDSLSSRSKESFDWVLEKLQALNIPFKQNPYLVRGLDYYNDCIFEFTVENFGAQNTLLAGGRYDQLIEWMGGKPTPSAGFAFGIERIAYLFSSPQKEPALISVIPFNESCENACLQLAQKLRTEGFKVDMAYSGNVSKRMKKANKQNAKVALIIGEDEIKSNQVSAKILSTGEQFQWPQNLLSKNLKEIFHQ